MAIEPEEIRKILSANVKTYRKKLGMSQEKLAATTELSDQTINDIEGCRMWVSDKTISKLTKALQIEAYQLLLPNSDMDEKYFIPLPAKIFRSLQESIKKSIDSQFDEILSAE